ncbi:sulfotransferase [Cesiribacter sp. SM1]|uniref:sulfotransferase family protein n=1 Tax=Cesiribacter sp. SM1 TaxID=2861196 RepID=UPI001CD71CCC|nr:sulfotransferase [Cesiribacter sp. SM1]
MNSLLPTFLIIGAGKSGTTSLHKYLDQHPEVFMCPVKETNFFELEGEELVRSRKQDPERFKHYPQSVTVWEEYVKLFNQATRAKAIGETSPMYLYGKRSPENIRKYLPEAKLIVILREPTSRLYSRYLHLARDGRLPTPNFEDALDKNNTVWWTRNDLVQEGFYYKHLSRYFEFFPREQIKIFLYEDLQKNPVKVMKELFGFIGVDDSFQPNMEVTYNLSGKPKNGFINSLIGADGVLIKSAKAVLPGGVVKLLKKSTASQKMVQNIRKKNLERPPVTPEVKKRFYSEVYADDIDKLEKLINRDLSRWKPKA